MEKEGQIRVDKSPVRCPYCHDGLDAAEEKWTACAGCLARHHADCWREAGRCAACSHPHALAPENESKTRVVTVREPGPYGGTTWIALKLMLALAVGAGAFYQLSRRPEHRYGAQDAAIFIGIPTIISIILVLTPKPRSRLGTILKGITAALCMSALVLGEGWICVLMASPLFYLVGFIVNWVLGRKRRDESDGPRLRSIFLVPLLVASLEGTSDDLSFSRAERVTRERVVAASVAEVEELLGSEPRFDRPLPALLGIGFPYPDRASGSGLSPGDRRVVHFTAGEGRPPGDLVLAVLEHRPGLVRFTVLSDASHINHWLAWRGSVVELEPVDAAHTRVRWTVEYDRRLDPKWYFGPIERFFVERASDYLIECLATPRRPE